MITQNTVEKIIKDAVKVNLQEFKKARKEYLRWRKRRENATSELEAKTFEVHENEMFYVYYTIKQTLVRLFPDHEDLIMDELYS